MFVYVLTFNGATYVIRLCECERFKLNFTSKNWIDFVDFGKLLAGCNMSKANKSIDKQLQSIQKLLSVDVP